MSHTILTRAAALALLAALSCSAPRGAGAEPDDPSVAWLVAHGRYAEAVAKAAEEKEQRPDDAAVDEAHRLASTAWLMDQGRKLYFDDRDDEALELFARAAAIAPESPEVEGWARATRDKLAETWFAVGLRHHIELEFDEAIAAYERCIDYRPDHPNAREALARVLVQQNYRSGMGEGYYNEGIVALDEYYLHEAGTMFSYVLKYEPYNERADKRREQTKELLASERATIAAGLEADGHFAAARNEYRLALLLEEDHPEARAGFERMQIEERAAEFLREAGRLLLKKDYEASEAKVAAAEAITQRQAEACQATTEAIAEARLEDRYVAARTMESDLRYEDAVQAYAELLELAPFYRDAIARKDTLESYVREAGELYARFEASSDEEERIGLLLQISVFWPEYRDVEERLAAYAAGQESSRR